MRDRVDGDLALLHALEQAGLRLRRRAVDLVDEHDVGEDRARAGTRSAPRAGCRPGCRRCRRAAGRPCTARARTGSRSSATARAPARSCRRPGSPRRGCGPRRAASRSGARGLSSRTFDRVADVLRDAAGDVDTAVSISACARRSGTASSRGSIQRRTFVSFDERAAQDGVEDGGGDRRPWTPSARARSPSAVTIETSLSAASKPIPAPLDVIDDDGVEVLALRASRARTRARRRRARRRSRRAAGRGGGARRARRARPWYGRGAGSVPRPSGPS